MILDGIFYLIQDTNYKNAKVFEVNLNKSFKFGLGNRVDQLMPNFILYSFATNNISYRKNSK